MHIIFNETSLLYTLLFLNIQNRTFSGQYFFSPIYADMAAWLAARSKNTEGFYGTKKQESLINNNSWIFISSGRET